VLSKVQASEMTGRTCYFFLCGVTLSLLAFRNDLESLACLSWNDNRYTHIALIPALSLALIVFKRRSIFRNLQYSLGPGLQLGALAALLSGFAKARPEYLGQHGGLMAAAAAIFVAWTAGFVLFYGIRSARAALFPLALLLLAVPLPPPVVEVVETTLQRGSAEVTYEIFRLTATPVFREGLLFSLPGFTIEVAQECSGIRSGISLLITALTLSHLFLRSGWSMACCILLTVPIAILKNAVRIATLSLLGVYVSQDYLHGNLHHRGGPVFSILSLLLLLTVLWLLRKCEDSAIRRKQLSAGSGVIATREQPTA
jgi:exosortase